MQKRSVIFGGYNTAIEGQWTLTALSFSEPEPVQNFVEVPGRSAGPLDMSTILTEGEPVYGSRLLSVMFESSEGDRQERAQRIAYMVNLLHGRRVDIVLPDHPEHYVTGRLSVVQQYNDLVHGAVAVSATCDPWFYSSYPVALKLTATATKKTAEVKNAGARTLVPEFVVEAAAGSSVLLEYGAASASFSAGTWTWPAFRLTPGLHDLTYSGSGTVTVKYREAVLR